MVLVLPEVQSLLLCGCLRTLADHTSILMLHDITDFTLVFIGAIAALLLAGLLHDTLLKQSTYLLLIAMNVLQIIVECTLFFVSDRSAAILGIYGFAMEFSSFYLHCLLPLKIADANRKGAYELTMAGTIIAVAQLAYFLAIGFA